MRKLIPLLLLGATACMPPAPTQLAPSVAHTSHSVAETVRLAAATLSAEGFDIAVSDADGGILTAKRSRENSRDGIQCRPSNIYTNTTTMTVSLIARADGASTAIQLTNRVHLAMPSSINSDDECASIGVIEGKVLAALGAK